MKLNMEVVMVFGPYRVPLTEADADNLRAVYNLGLLDAKGLKEYMAKHEPGEVLDTMEKRAEVAKLFGVKGECLKEFMENIPRLYPCPTTAKDEVTNQISALGWRLRDCVMCPSFSEGAIIVNASVMVQ